MGTLDTGREERGPARETEKEPAVELEEGKNEEVEVQNKVYRGKKCATVNFVDSSNEMRPEKASNLGV